MREDQRPDRQQPEDEAEDRFDDALDDLFGPDEPGPEPAAGVVPPDPPPPPPRVTASDLIDVLEQRSHQLDEEDNGGPANAPPPPSYRAVEEQPAAEPQTGRSWKRIACLGCLTFAGIVGACLAALLVIGLIADEDEGEPTAIGRFVEVSTSANSDAMPNPTSDLPGRSPVESAIMGERQSANVEIDGEGGFGALEKPAPVGVEAALGDGWLLRVDAVDLDAEQAVLEANEFNEPAAVGRRYVIAAVTATNDTSRAAYFSAAFRLRLLGLVTNTVYMTFETDQFCGVVPDQIDEHEILPGASTSGNVCWIVEERDVDELVLFSENYDVGELAIWFAVSDDASLTSGGP